ncbi:unnamed protein product [Ectocarpus sp. CCAP 1310/34]|nr:unnamed protein product [Ectocarpus sp. CCAP 1310/34]
MVAVAGAKPHPPRDLFVDVDLVVVWGGTRGVEGPRDATAATGVPRESGQGEARGTRVLATEESRHYGNYDDGYYYEDGYYDAGYAHYAGGGDSYSYPSGSEQQFTNSSLHMYDLQEITPVGSMSL